MQTARWLGNMLICAAAALPAVSIAAEKLIIDHIISNTVQRTAWVNLVDQFSAAHPDIAVTIHSYPQEPYKRDLLQRLQTGKTDLAFWYGGERLRDAARKKLLSPLDAGVLKALNDNKFAKVTIDSTRVDGEVYGFPLYYYGWGLVYRKSLFERLGLRPPATWTEFLAVCKQLKAAGVTPLAVGGQHGWPAAGWFDYLNLRINGLEFHHRLLLGEERFTDPKVRKVFDVWGDLLRNGYFLNETMDQDWDRVLPYMYRDQVGMTLIGSFVAAKFPATFSADMGFFAFPRYAPDMPAYEDAPLDVLILPARGENRQARNRFLVFLAESGALGRFSESNQTVSAKGGNLAPPGSVRNMSYSLVHGAAGLALFFDRDAKASLIGPAFDAIRQFLKPPHDTDRAVRAIEHSQKPAASPPAHPPQR